MGLRRALNSKRESATQNTSVLGKDLNTRTKRGLAAAIAKMFSGKVVRDGPQGINRKGRGRTRRSGGRSAFYAKSREKPLKRILSK